MRVRRPALLFLLSLLAVPGPLRAQPLDECSRIDAEAFAHMQAARLDEAQRAYARAYALCRDPKLLYNLGRAAHKAGQPAKAAGYYQHYLATRVETDPAQIQRAQQFLAQAQREAAAAPDGALGPRQAQVRSRDAGTAPTPVYKKWWLWTLVGVGVAGVAVGVGLGVAARRPDLSGAAVATPFP